MPRIAHILLVEDNPGDVVLLQQAFARLDVDVNIAVVGDGRAALSFLRRESPHEGAPIPALVILDLSLPRMDGYQVLTELRGDPLLTHVPVIVYTGSDSTSDILASYDLGANACITKPMDPDEIDSVARAISRFWLGAARLPEQ